MLFDLTAARANVRNRDGKRVFYLGSGDQLNSAARDWLQAERIEILPASMAKPERYRLESGGYLEEKPEHMTHLHGDVLVPKDHPRIMFRGAVDMLEAQILLCGQALPHLRPELELFLKQARVLIRAEVLNDSVEKLKLCNLSPEELRSHSHRPQDFYGKPHFMPDFDDGAVLQLNRLRCAVRDAERLAVAAIPDREDILQVLNRMSSAVYILMIREK